MRFPCIYVKNGLYIDLKHIYIYIFIVIDVIFARKVLLR